MGAIMTQDTDLLTVEEAAQRFHVSISAVRQWYRRGTITKYQRKIDKAVFVRASEIERAMQILPLEEEAEGDE